MKSIKYAAAAVLLAASGLASAASYVATGAATAVPGSGSNNEFFGQLTALGNQPSGITALAGGSLSTAAGNYDVTYTYVGSEAGFSNIFTNAGSTPSIATGGNTDNWSLSGYSSSTQTSVNGLLNFSFTSTQPAGTVVNGGTSGLNANNAGDQNFLILDPFSNAGLAPLTAVTGCTAGNCLYLLFEDNGPNTADNHDDMVIRVTFAPSAVSAVPEPGEWALMLAGLGITGMIARRRSTKRATVA